MKFLNQDIFRKCSAQNLNLSPLCNLDFKTFPYFWGEDVAGLYNDTLPEYVRDIVATLRPVYRDSSLVDRDILAHSKEVNILRKHSK